MPIDFASGFNRGGYDPTGFAGRSRGGYFDSVYGYDDQGRAVNDRNQMAQINAQRNAPVQAPSQAPTMSPDFFSALAGLMGGGNPYAPQVAPQMGAQKPQGYNLGEQIAQYGQNANRPQIITPGGQGPYGGVSPEGQRAMFEGNARAWGNFAQGQGRQQGLGYGPTPSSPYAPAPRAARNPMNQGTGRAGMGRTNPRTNPLSNLPNRGGTL